MITREKHPYRTDTERVARALKHAILTGDFVPNQRLTEANLSEKFSASRGTIRSAITELAVEGVVEKLPSRGARVRAISREEAQEILEVRTLLEGLCAEKAATRITDLEITELTEIGTLMQRLIASGDTIEYSQQNQILHQRIIAISGQHTAANTINRLHAQSVRYQFRLWGQKGRANVSLDEHLEVIQALADRNPGRARLAMQAHLHSVGAAIERTAEGQEHHAPDSRDRYRQGVRCMLMRGGTSKGAYFLAPDLPEDPALRDELLLAIMGSPDPRQIDGLGGAHPLTSKVAIVAPSPVDGIDVDYLFLQLTPNSGLVTDEQNCGNLLAGIGPFAVERGLVPAGEGHTRVSIRMINTMSRAIAVFRTDNGMPLYRGNLTIDGVPLSAAPIELEFLDTVGSSTGALFPTGAPIDVIDGIPVSCLDNGMPSVMIRATDLGLSGDEAPAELEADTTVTERIQRLRETAGPLMGLGDVHALTVPKMVLLSVPRHHGGTVNTRSFIPHRVHNTIGILGGATVAAAIMTPGAIGSEFAPSSPGPLRIEHPSGHLDVSIAAQRGSITSAALLRTARKIFDGIAFPGPRF